MNEAPPSDDPNRDRIIAHTRAWVDRAVIGLNLCPFAGPAAAGGRLRFELSPARGPERLLEDLHGALNMLADAPADELETVLLVAPWALGDFLEFNDFLDLADAMLAATGLEGTIQIASFHPRYQFADTEPDDPGNATNRAPYPCLHLLREASIERALAAGADADAIVARNLATLDALGPDGWDALEAACRRDAGLDP